ncbi:HAD-IIB family hydrolase [Sphingorhabdus sp. SMR4y]|uniref:HAD-IIB family hydrolase n=1 Tax=Sphingorhabdus sp. SMR4y TaxID=2584094 RepID=UPI000B5C2CEC|nr:HAD-IIB family hydrolase [Sphingorhabdus sp. SMR4y]ASK88345.1 glucosyl-3-phosphoglycerate/mannosyl-3- phosphoglycerate phosphatase [Sphingorhabdus sp. SMR4y]
MTKRPVYPVIFTDLDGTLLDHHSYSAKPADALAASLSRQSLAEIIPVTSKTHAELLCLQREIPLPFSLCVTENGSVIHGPDSYFPGDDGRSGRLTLGMAYPAILDQIGKMPGSLRRHFRGFADMSVHEVVDATGLAVDDARRAKDRQATEPFLWSGTDGELETLATIVAESGLRIQRGGRFYHLTGHATKEQAMAQIIETIAGHKPDCDLVSIALGDGPNDLAMIEAADFGVIMPNPQGVTIISTRPAVRTAPVPGPAGWVTAVTEILAELGLNIPES